MTILIMVTMFQYSLFTIHYTHRESNTLIIYGTIDLYDNSNIERGYYDNSK